MKLSEQEKAARKVAFRAMSFREKTDHILTYYKWPIILCLLALVILVSTLYRQMTRKEPVLYLAMINVSVGADLEEQLSDGYLLASGSNPNRQQVYLYRDLYLSENADTLNHQYEYASQMKLTGAISTRKLDLVLMNREAYDIFSRKGYLLDLSFLTSEKSRLPDRLTPLLTENEVILHDNSLEVMLGEATEEQRVSELFYNAVAAESLPLFRDARFDGELYLGIMANSERLEEILHYITYLSE